jgi:hypothetical protein
MKALTLLSIATLIYINAIAQTTYPSGVSGCIARWTFDASEGGGLTTIADVSGNGNHGTNNNISSTNGWKNITNTAGKFNGTSSWAEVVHNSMLNVSNVTMICLVKMNGFNSALCEANQFISKGYPYFVPGNYGLGLGDDNPCGSFNPNGVRLITQNGNGSPTFALGNYISLNKWYFFAGTIGPNLINQYQVEMNPLLKETSISPINSYTAIANIGTNAESISIGRHLNPQYPYWVNGDIDELILFNKALTSSEIYSVYDYLYGSPNSSSNIELLDNNPFQVSNTSSEISIETNETNYSILVYNSVGQLILSKNQCTKSQTISILSRPTQLTYIKIIDSKGHLFTSKALFE